MLNDINQYAEFIYSLPEKFPDIIEARIDLFTIGQNLLKITGIIYFPAGIVLCFNERINIKIARYQKYYYEVRKNDQLLLYYDPQPHPDDPDFASTFPHHKHVPPDIKHNRQPAPDLSFDRPNLPALIQEIVDTLS
jgi:hypothetical protein